MAALGSILSWDDADDNDNNGNKSEDDGNVALNDNERCTRQGAQVPFDTVQFANRNFISNGASYNNIANGESSSSGNAYQLQMQAHQENDSQKLSIPNQSQTEGSESNQRELLSQQRQPPLHQQQQQPQVGMLMNLSVEQQQFIAQNPQAFAQFLANTVLQQPNQQQQLQASQPQAQQQMPLNQGYPGMTPSQPTMSNAIQYQDQQALQLQQTQQQQQSQTSFSSDQNALLQQYQMAQYQQQLQSAQAQPQAQPNMQLQGALQQLQAHFTQAQGNIGSNVRNQSSNQDNACSTPSFGSVPQSVASKVTSSQLPKKPKTLSSLSSNKKTISTTEPPKTRINSKPKDQPLAGIVSASDTDGEVSRMAKELMTIDECDNDDDPDADLDHLSPTEKLKASRDRNREHARNTRLRKKAYLEKLKLTVDELCRERDTLVSERTGAASLLVEMHNTRTEVLMSLFALRTSNERRRNLWASILDESCFTCVLPVTPYRSFPASEVQVSKCLRTVLGIDGMIADTASIHVLFDSLVDRAKFPCGKVDFRYTLVAEEAVVAGNQVMARWLMNTTNAVKLGARMELSKQGMLCCKFNSAHKIVSLELMFDVMAFMLQLKQASGSDGFTVIPNTLQTCQRAFEKPMVMVQAEPPYTIVQVNKLWEDMTGYTAAEVVGRSSCAVLQGEDMDKVPLNLMMEEVRHVRPSSALLGNRRKSGEDFMNFIVVYPLTTDSSISYYIGLTLYHAIGKYCKPNFGRRIESEASYQSTERSSNIRTHSTPGVDMTALLAARPAQVIQNLPMMASGLMQSIGPPTVLSNPGLTQLSHLSFLPQAPMMQTTQHLGQSSANMGTLKRQRDPES
jgi:PAS domain S-box-containing protein